MHTQIISLQSMGYSPEFISKLREASTRKAVMLVTPGKTGQGMSTLLNKKGKQ